MTVVLDKSQEMEKYSSATFVANAENLLIIEGKPKLMAAHLKNFKDHMEHSHEYKGRQQ